MVVWSIGESTFVACIFMCNMLKQVYMPQILLIKIIKSYHYFSKEN